MNGMYFASAYPSRREKRAQLFAFPYAGGGSVVFKKWQPLLSNIEVFPAQYPGRERRMAEPSINRFDILLDAVFLELKTIIKEDMSYFLFGHSLGTKIAYELALMTEKQALPIPKGLILAAGKAPCFGETRPIHQLDEEAFIREIGRFSGTPKEILENRELMHVFLPMLRADFTIDETYKRDTVLPLNCPIMGLMGAEDAELTLDELLKWRDYTKTEFSYKVVEGGHMFVNTRYRDVITYTEAFIHERINKRP